MLRICRTLCAAATLLFVFYSGGLNGSDDKNQKPQQKRSESVSTEDTAALAACLKEFREQKDVGSGDRSEQTLVVDVRTERPSWYLSNAQLTGDLEGTGWRIPIDAEYDLRRRNEHAVSLRDAHLGDKIVMDDFDRLRKQQERSKREFAFLNVMRKAHPGFKAYVSFWLPGYTKEKTKCVVRLSFGWTAHGAGALYLLEKRDGKWTILKRAIIYYA
jgi:hypothetical protein